MKKAEYKTYIDTEKPYNVEKQTKVLYKKKIDYTKHQCSR